MRNRKSNIRNRENAFFDTISKSLDIPVDAVAGFAHIEMSGNREISVDGCLGVLEYGENRIVLNTGRLTVKICGCDLTVTSMQNGQAIIKGTLTCVEFGN